MGIAACDQLGRSMGYKYTYVFSLKDFDIMKAAICGVCEAPPASTDVGCWITFSDYIKNKEVELSHPCGLEYFCAKHIKAAQALSHMSSENALVELKGM